MALPLRPVALLLLVLLPSAALAGEFSKAEFRAQSKDYVGAFTEAAASLKELIQADGIEVVAVAEFTGIDGQPLHIGRLYAEELSTLLVGPRKTSRVMDPGSSEALGRAAGDAALWGNAKRMKEFRRNSDVELVVTGRIEIAEREARFLLKAIETEGGSIAWARTLSVPGVAAGTEAAALPLATPPALPALESQPVPAASAPDAAAAPADSAPTDAAPAGSAPASDAATEPKAEVAPTPPASAAAAGPDAPVAARPEAPAPSAPAVVAPIVAPIVAAPAAAAPPAPAEVAAFENGWLRARIRSASKYEGSGWVTAVVELTNLTERTVFVDVAQGDPGKGLDELGNAWRVERVSGLRLAANPNAGMTLLAPRTTLSVVMVLATSAGSSGRRLSFGPNLLWFGSVAPGDSGRVTLAFANVRVD